MITSNWAKSSYSNPSGNCLEASFQKSSYSAPGGNCLEAGAWVKSSHSQTEIMACVEAQNDKVVRVRDSKDVLVKGFAVSPAAWSAFVQSL